MSLGKFFDLTERLYATQQSQSYPELQWSEIEKLLISLEVTLNQQIPEKYQFQFIEFLLKYIELALSYLSSFKITQYALQMKYFSRLLYFLPEALNAQKLCNLFVTTSTMGILDLLIYMNFSTFAKRHLLFVFNRNLEKCDQETKEATGTENVSYIYKLMDLLPTYGDYSLQCDVLETVFRLYPHLIKSKDLKYSILPEMPELGAALSTEISPDTFDSDIRAWLSKLNKNSPHIFSIEARKVTLGNVLCTPHQADMIWLDFNLKDQVLSFSTVTGVKNCEWNLLYFPVQYVQSIEVHKPQSFVEIKKNTVVKILTKLCISANNQSYWNTVGKTLEIVISDEKNEQTSWLISHVLPKMFGRVFQHRSSIRRSTNSKRVYRPLRQLSKSRSSQASRSKRRSSTHNSDYVTGTDLSGSLESTEKSLFDGQSCVPSKICVNISSKTVAINQKSSKSEPTDDLQEKFSYGPTASICSNSSLDMTNFSRTDSRPVTPAQERIESLQDNLVTSSKDEIIVSSSDILLGQSKPRDLPSIIDSVDFQPSELFSSSPFHRSVNTQEFLETATENLKEDFEVAALRLAEFDLDSDASQKIEKKSSFVMEVDEPSGKQSILEPPQIVEVDSVKESSFVEDKYSVLINTNFETATENKIYVDDLNVSNKEFVAQRLTQFELNTQSSEQQAVVEYTNEKSVRNKQSLVQLAFKSTNSDFETAIEGPDYSWDNLSKTDVVEKRSLVQIPLKETTGATHDSGNLGNTDVGTVVEKRSLDHGAVKATNKNLDKTELRNDDVAQRLTQFELNSQGEIKGCHLLDAIVTIQQSVTNNTVDINQEVKSMTQESSHSRTELTDLKPKLPLQITEEVQDTVDRNQEVMTQESISDYQSFHLSHLTKEAAERIEFDQKLLSPEPSQSSRLSASPKLTEETQKVQFTTKLLRVNLVREPLIKIRTKKMDSGVSSETASPVQKLTQSNSFISFDLNQAKCVSEGSVYTQFETVAKRLTQFQLDSDPQLEEANRVKPVDYLVPNQKPEGLKNLIVNLVKDPTIIAEDVTTVPEDLTSNNVETVEHSLTPDFDKTTQDLFSQLSLDTQGRQTVPEESSDDVFHLQTQDVIGELSLKVNVGVFTNESTVDKNVLQFTDVESAVEEIFIDSTKDEVAEIEVMEDRHLSTQELLTVLDKTISQKSLNASSDASNEADAGKSFLLKLDPLLDIHFIKVSPAAAKPAATTFPKYAPAVIELSQDQKKASCKIQEDIDKIYINSLSPDTQARQTVPEESSDDVFHLQTQDVIGESSLKVNVGVFTNESTVDKNVLQFTEVESAVEEIFIDSTKDEVAEIEMMEDRHLSTQELLTVLDKTVSEKSLNASCKIQEDIDIITVINSPTTEDRKTILEEPEPEVFANYNDTNATKNAANILKRLINFLEENNKAEEESLAEKPIYKKPKKDKPAKKESKPKKYPPRTLFDENNLSYMDTLNWSTPDYDSGQSYHDDHAQSIKVVKRRREKLRKLKNNSTSKKDKKQQKRKPKRMKIESSMQGLTCGVSHIKTTEEIFPVLKNTPRKRTFSKYDPFWDAVARDLSEIPASKSTTSIQASSDSCSPFFTDGSTASSQKLPELEIEPIGTNFNEQRQSPKIRVLQNIVIAQPTQLRPVAELCHEPSPKKLKLDQDDEFLHVNVPSEHPVLDNNLMRDAWEAMHKITTWIVRGKEKNVQNVIDFIKSLPHKE